MKKMTVMLDCSRNAVIKVETLKEYIDIIALFGYSRLMLYTEDTYEIEGEPYFGYFRGRYTQEELKEIDDYAFKKGIELIPCIQTLAHLDAIFRWGKYRSINDCENILLLEEEKTYELIEKMMITISKCFRSRIVNIGMDEAHMMGLGRYLDIHGYQDKNKLFLKHLDRVVELAEKYNFKPLIWSDMFYRMAGHGEYFNVDIKIDKEVVDLVPKNLGLIYWDYYHRDEEFYTSMIKNHQEFNNEIWFAGGTWTWMGFAPLNEFALNIIKPAMTSCNLNNIDNVIITQWGDNGGECSFFASLPSLFYAIKVYNNEKDLNVIKKEFYDIMHVEFDDLIKFDLVNQTSSKNHHNCPYNTSKYMLYNDPFMGVLDSSVIEGESNIYKDYAKMYQKLKVKMPKFAYLCDLYKSLSEVLFYKYELGTKTRKYYKNKDLNSLSLLIKDYDSTINKLNKFIKVFKETWYKENKPHGFDVQEIRLGGLLLRLKSCKERLKDYVNGNISIIEELEEDILDINGVSGKEHSHNAECFNVYSLNATTNIL